MSSNRIVAIEIETIERERRKLPENIDISLHWMWNVERNTFFDNSIARRVRLRLAVKIETKISALNSGFFSQSNKEWTKFQCKRLSHSRSRTFHNREQVEIPWWTTSFLSIEHICLKIDQRIEKQRNRIMFIIVIADHHHIFAQATQKCKHSFESRNRAHFTAKAMEAWEEIVFQKIFFFYIEHTNF